jgi:hypothetical protein
MDKQQAPKIVADMGEGYFLDWVHDYENIEIGIKHGLAEVKDAASHSMPTGPNSWEIEEEAAKIVLDERDQAEQDQILRFYFGIKPETIGGSRAFFERLHAAIQEGLDEARNRNSEA